MKRVRVFFLIGMLMSLLISLCPAQLTQTPQVLPGVAPLPAAPLPAPAPPPPPAPPGVPAIPGVQFVPLDTILSRSGQAFATARAVLAAASAGKVWMMRAPAGEVEVKAALLYQNNVVAVLRFHPLTGQLLPRGVNPRAVEVRVNTEAVKRRLQVLIPRLTLVPAGEYREPESCWVFPIAWNNMAVAELKVFYDGQHVVQDFGAAQEMSFYGQ